MSEIQRIINDKKVALLDIEMRGILKIKESKKIETTLVLVEPPSIEELKKRLYNRGDTSEEAIKKRLERALWELSFKQQPGFFDYIVVNDDVETAYKDLRSVVEKIQIESY